MIRNIACLVVSLLFCCACASVPKMQESYSSTLGPFDEYHQQRHTLGDEETSFGPSRSESELGSEIQAIGIEHTSCYGLCPEYTALYCENGIAWYCGRANIEPQGCFEGFVPPGEFRIVAAAMQDIGFFDMPHTFAALVTDESSVMVLGTRRGGETNIVRDYAEGGPPRLWLLEHLLDSMIDRIDWTAIDDSSVVWECPEETETTAAPS